MPLLFTGTWEQAVITTIARVVAGHADPGSLGRTALQRIVYFLQIAGVPFRYAFHLYFDGPSCDRLSWDIDSLLSDNVLKDVETSSEKYPNYRPSDAAEELLQSHAARLQSYQETIGTVVQAMLPLDLDHLELLAAVDYLYRQKRAGGGSGPWKEFVLDRVMQVKKNKFGRTAVSDAYDSMVRAKLFEA